jgi:hypothetical protein
LSGVVRRDAGYAEVPGSGLQAGEEAVPRRYGYRFLGWGDPVGGAGGDDRDDVALAFQNQA